MGEKINNRELVKIELSYKELLDMAKKDKKKWNPIALEILEDSIKFCLQDKPEWPYLKELNQLLTTNPRDYDQESRIHELLISLGINFDKLRERVALRYAKFNGIKIIDE